MLSGCPKLHHFFFTDGSLFFIKGTVENARTLKTIIMDYCRASGQQINESKSTLTYNRGANADEISTIMDYLHFAVDPKKRHWVILKLESRISSRGGE